MGNEESTIDQLEEHCRNDDSAKFAEILKLHASEEILQKPYKSAKNDRGWQTVGAYLLFFTLKMMAIECLRIILGYVTPAGKDKDGLTPLHYAAAMDSPNFVSTLLEYGAQVTTKDKYGCLPIHLAAREGRAETLQLLCKAAGADINLRSDDGSTPLHCAVENYHAECVSTLVDLGAKTYLSNHMGVTARKLAVRSNFHFLVGLIDKPAAGGATKPASTQPTAAPLLPPKPKESAAGMANEESTIDRLEEYCRNDDSAKLAEVVSMEVLQNVYNSPKNPSGWPTVGAYLLSFAMKLEAVQCLRIILGYVSVDVKDKDGWTPLHEAAELNSPNVATVLLEHGAQVNATDSNGWSPIRTAAWKNSVQTLQLLCDSEGADINLHSGDGWAPLIYAVWYHHTECVRTLLDHSARTDICTADNQTARELAMEMEYSDIVDLLDEAAAATTSVEPASTQPTAAPLLPPKPKESATGEEVTIPAQGGEFDLHNGTVRLSVPSGAVGVDGAKSTVYMSGSKGEKLPFKQSSVYRSQAFKFASDTSLSFNQPLTVTIPNISFSPGGKVLVFCSSSEEGELPNFQDVTEECRPVFANGAVQFTVTHFSEWFFVIAAATLVISAKEVVSRVATKTVRLDAGAAQDLTSCTDCIPLSLCLVDSGSQSPLLTEAGCQLVTSSGTSQRMSLAFYQQAIDIELAPYGGPQPPKSSSSGAGGYWSIPSKFLPVCLKQDTVVKVQLVQLPEHPPVETPPPGCDWVVAVEGTFKCTIRHYTGGSTEAFVVFQVPATATAVRQRLSRRESRTSSTSSSGATADTVDAVSDDAKESMGLWQCEAIRSHGTQLTGSLELDDVILATLRTKKVLSLQRYKEIQRKRMPLERNQLLLETLPDCGNNAFQVFIGALRDSKKLNNQQLAKTLASISPSTPGVDGGTCEEVRQQVHDRQSSAPVSGESDPWESTDYRGCYAQLIRTMDPHEVKTLCYTLQLISDSDKQIINSKTTPFEKNEAILDCVARSTSHFGKFREVLHHIDACSDIAKHLDMVGPRRGQDEGCQKARDNLNR